MTEPTASQVAQAVDLLTSLPADDLIDALQVICNRVGEDRSAYDTASFLVGSVYVTFQDDPEPRP